MNEALNTNEEGIRGGLLGFLKRCRKFLQIAIWSALNRSGRGDPHSTLSALSMLADGSSIPR